MDRGEEVTISIRLPIFRWLEEFELVIISQLFNLEEPVGGR
jgi:hypothetical protein